MVGDHDMKFSVDSKTLVEARGGSTKAGQAAASGTPGPHLDELLKAGQPVAVTYNGDRQAASARRRSRRSRKSRASTAPADATLQSDGVVKSMGPTGSPSAASGGGGASFEQTFKIDSSTKVYAKGAGTATAARGGSCRSPTWSPAATTSASRISPGQRAARVRRPRDDEGDALAVQFDVVRTSSPQCEA